MVSNSVGNRSTALLSVIVTILGAAGSIGVTVSIGITSAGPMSSGITPGRTIVGAPPTRTPGP